MAYTTVTAPLSDQELAAAAGEGDAAAFEELYRRHLPAATGVALAVAGNREDAGDAVAEGFARVLQALPTVRTRTFRAYLLTVTRHAAIDIHRRSRRLAPSDEIEAFDTLPGDDPAEQALTAADAVLLRQAFATLPERWRSVLWLLEVERLPAQEVGAALGLTANNVAQIGVRARSRLRERYLQAHLGPHPHPACEFTTRRLGAYLTATLSPRDVTKADAHLRTCGVCRHRRDDLRELGLKMRSVLPVPVGLIPLLRTRHRADDSLHQIRVSDGASPTLGPPTMGPPTLRPPTMGPPTLRPPTMGTPTMAATASSASSLEAPIAVVRTALELGAAQVAAHVTALSGGAPLVQRVVGGAAAALAAIGVSSVAVRTDVVASSRTPDVVPPAMAAPSPPPATATAGPAAGGGAGSSTPASDAGGGLLGIGLAGASTPDPPAVAALPKFGESTTPPVGAADLPRSTPDPSTGVVPAASGLLVAAVPDPPPATGLAVTPPGSTPLSSTVPGSPGPSLSTGVLPETSPVPAATPSAALPGALNGEPTLTPVENVIVNPGPAAAAGQVSGISSVASGAVPPADEAVTQALAPASDPLAPASGTLTPLVDAPASLAPTALPPTALPPTALPPTALPPAALPPTALPPTALPPTALPPTALPPTALPPTAVATTDLPPTALPPTAVAPTAVATTAVAPTDLAPTTAAPTAVAGAAPVLQAPAPSVTPLVDPLTGTAAQGTGQVTGQAAGAAAAGVAAAPVLSILPAAGVL